MMISTKAKLSFLAMPRNASTSIEAALLPFSDIVFQGVPRFKHINLAIYNLRLRPFLDANNYQDIQTVALFREPIDWLSSWFRYRSDPAIKLKRNSTAGLNFNEFVEAYLSVDTPDFAKVGQQSQFVRDKLSRCGIDYLFKFENLAFFRNFLEEKFGKQIEFLPSNASQSRDRSLSPELTKALKNHFAVDYEIYETIAV